MTDVKPRYLSLLLTLMFRVLSITSNFNITRVTTWFLLVFSVFSFLLFILNSTVMVCPGFLYVVDVKKLNQ